MSRGQRDNRSRFAAEVEVIRKRLSFPDVSSRSGLKKFLKSSNTYVTALKHEWYSKPADRIPLIVLIEQLMMDDKIRRCFVSAGELFSVQCCENSSVMFFSGFADILLTMMNDAKLSWLGIGYLPTLLLFGLAESADDIDPSVKKFIAEKGAVTAFDAIKRKQMGEYLNDDDDYHVRHFEHYSYLF